MRKRKSIGKIVTICLLALTVSGCGVNEKDIEEAKKAAQIFRECENAHYIITLKSQGKEQPTEISWEYWYDSAKGQRGYMVQTTYDENGNEQFRIGHLRDGEREYINPSMQNENETWHEVENEMTLPPKMLESVFLEEAGQYQKTSIEEQNAGSCKITLVHGKEALKDRNQKLQEDPIAENPNQMREYSIQIVINKEKQPEYLQEDYTMYDKDNGEMKFSSVIQVKSMNDEAVLQELEKRIKEAGIEP